MMIAEFLAMKVGDVIINVRSKKRHKITKRYVDPESPPNWPRFKYTQSRGFGPTRTLTSLECGNWRRPPRLTR